MRIPPAVEGDERQGQDFRSLAAFIKQKIP